MRDYILTPDSLSDQITIMNLSNPGKTYRVSQAWYRAVVKFGLWHECYFDVVVSMHRFSPLRPMLVVSDIIKSNTKKTPPSKGRALGLSEAADVLVFTSL